MAKQTEALQLPEVLEAILLEVDPATLLTSAQRVCRAWGNMVTSSIPIKKKLFLVADYTVSTPQKNSLLAKHFPMFFRDRIPDEDPLFDDTMYQHKHMLNLGPEGPPFARNLPAFMCKGATWRQMLLQQPPQRRLGFARDLIDGWTCMGSVCDVAEFERGVSLGWVYDAMYYWMSKPEDHRRYFQLWWESRDLYESGLPPGAPPDSGKVDLILYIRWNPSRWIEMDAEFGSVVPVDFDNIGPMSVPDYREFWDSWFRSESYRPLKLGEALE